MNSIAGTVVFGVFYWPFSSMLSWVAGLFIFVFTEPFVKRTSHTWVIYYWAFELLPGFG
jgi:hypothetical protein